MSLWQSLILASLAAFTLPGLMEPFPVEWNRQNHAALTRAA